MSSVVLAVILAAAVPQPASSTAPADAPLAASKQQAKPPPPSPKPGDEFNFDLLEPGKPPPQPAVDPAFEAEVRQRRTMLQWHQGLGFALLGSLAATEVLGQLNFNDQFRGGGDTGKWNTPHLVMAGVSTGLFATVGLLGVLAPEPYPKKTEFDTAFVHKTFMSLATAGMVTEVILGLVASNSKGDLSERNLAAVHQVVGYVTAGCVAAGAITYVF